VAVRHVGEILLPAGTAIPLVLVDRAGKLAFISANAAELTETVAEGCSGAASCLLNWTNIAVAEKTAIVFCLYRGWHAT
jgi:hypothetical protein